MKSLTLPFYFSLLVLLLNVSRAEAQVFITADTTWKTDQVLTESIVIDSGVTLSIDPDVVIGIDFLDTNVDSVGEIAIVVNGRLNIQGEPCHRVHFEPTTIPIVAGKYWQGILINSTENNDTLTYFEVSQAEIGVRIQSMAHLVGAEVFGCTEGITVDATGVGEVEETNLHDNIGTGLSNYGGSLTLNHSQSHNNGKFGLSNHGGILTADYSNIDTNSYGGVYLGSGTNSLQNCQVRANIGAGFEVSEWVFTTDFDTLGVKGSNPMVTVNGCNIENNAGSMQSFSDTEVRKIVNIIRPWGDCVGGYPSLVTGECRSTATFEVPFGSFDELRPDVSHLVKFSPSTTHYHFNYRLRRDYDGSILDNFVTTTSATNCLVSSTVKQVIQPADFTVPGFVDKYDWEVCALSHLGTNLMRPTLMDGTYTMKAGSFEVSSTVGTAQSQDFTNNWWGTVTGLSSLMHDVDVANIDYSSNLTTPNLSAGPTLPDYTPLVNLGADTSLCQGQYLSLNAGNPGESYMWSTGDSSQTLDSINVPGLYWVEVNSNCGIARDSIEMDLFAVPVVTVSGTSSICEGDSGLLIAAGAASYVWDSGVATGDSLGVMPSASTLYHVEGTDTNGCSASDSVEVQVNPLPLIMASSDTAICIGDTALLTASNGDTYLWDMGASTASIMVAPVSTLVYAVEGTDTNGCSALDSVEVQVNPLPLVMASSDTAICIGDTALLTASNGDTYLWDMGASTASIMVAPVSTLIYAVEGTDTNGCTASDSVEVQVNPLPLIMASSDTAICIGDTALLTASNGDTYLWDMGASTASIMVAPVSTLIYAVEGTDTNGCSASDSVEVQVNPLPLIMASSDTAICIGDTALLTASNGDTYLWDMGASTASIMVAPVSTLIYAVEGTDTNGCSASDSVEVQVNPLPLIMASSDTAICIGDTALLTASNGDTYLWDIGASTASIMVAPVSTLVYAVEGTDTNGCSASDSVEVQVNPLPLIVATPDTAICYGDSVLLTATGGDTYLWDMGAGTGPTVMVAPLIATTYQVTAEDTNGCTNFDETVVDIISIDTAVTVSGEILTADHAGVLYQWIDCANGDTAIVGEVNQSYSPMVSGSYAVVITQDDCSDTSSCYPVIIVSTPAHLSNSQVRLFPNPMEENCTLDLGEELSGAGVEIYDLTGKLMERRQLDRGRFHALRLTGSPGIYFILVRLHSETVTLKAVKY